jgi:hypothetical protein
VLLLPALLLLLLLLLLPALLLEGEWWEVALTAVPLELLGTCCWSHSHPLCASDPSNPLTAANRVARVGAKLACDLRCSRPSRVANSATLGTTPGARRRQVAWTSTRRT